MKTLLLILSLIISFNVNSADYANQYKNAPSTDNYIMLQSQSRIRELSSQILKLENLMKYRKATPYQIALHKKLLAEYNYLSTKYGNNQ